MEAIVLAGGFGTRLACVVPDVPKPMAPVAGRPFIEYILDDLADQGIKRIIIAVCHKKELIIDHLGSSYHGVEICYSEETEPLLTGGAVKQALQYCKDERVFIINGDTYFQVDLQAMRQYALNTSSAVVLAVREMQGFDRYGQVKIDAQRNVIAFCEKRYFAKGYINGGIYDLGRRVLDSFPATFSLEDECFPKLAGQGTLRAFPSDGFFIDIGIPSDYEMAQRCFNEKRF